MAYRATAGAAGTPAATAKAASRGNGSDPQCNVLEIGMDKGLTHYEVPLFTTFSQDSAPYFAEFLGAFLLTMTFLCNSTANSDVAWAVTSNGFANMAVCYSLFHVSGANCNPSVTIALMLAGRHTYAVAAKFCLAQIVGALVAAALRASMSDVQIMLGPRDGFGWYEADTIEVMYTAMLCFVFLNCAASLRNNPTKDQNGFFGLAVGFCFVAGGYAGRAFGPTCMNSAVAIGIGIVHFGQSFSFDGIHYLGCDILGGFVGAGLFRLVRPEEFDVAQFFERGEGMHFQDKVAPKIAAEFIGTFFIVLTKALNRVSHIGGEGPESWSVAAALTAMVYSLRDVSGGYFNPAVVLSIKASQRGIISLHEVVWNVAVEVFAGIIAGSTVTLLAKDRELHIRTSQQYSQVACCFSEGAFSFLICYVVLSTSAKLPGAKTKCNNIAGLAYGSCHTVGGFAIGHISGSMLNPAVLLAFSSIGVIHFQSQDPCLDYLLWQILGALLAAPAFFLTHPAAYTPEAILEAIAHGPLQDSIRSEKRQGENA